MKHATRLKHSRDITPSRGSPGGGAPDPFAFSQRSMAHLLFPLHRNACRQLETAYRRFSRENPAGARGLLQAGLAMSRIASNDPVEVEPVRASQVPRFDIRVEVECPSPKRLHKAIDARVGIVAHAGYGAGDHEQGCHVVIQVRSGGASETYMVPIPYLMKGMEALVTRPGAYQLYRHGLIAQTATGAERVSRQVAQENLHTYIGITRRSWQARYREHRLAAGRGSHLRFHRALRGELFVISHREHEVVRAGLTENEALQLEEAEVEAHSLAPMPRGLNMIPGGRAGIRYLRSAWGSDDPRLKDADRMESLLEDYVGRNLRQGSYEGAASKIAELWRTDLQYRIRAMTSQANRIAYAEIRAARVYQASGWSVEKTLDRLNALRPDTQHRIGQEQLRQLLAGKTYSSIPHVMVDED